MTDQELRDLVASLAVESSKTDEQMKKTDEQRKEASKEMKELRLSQEETNKQMKETDRKLKSVGIQLGNIGKNHGDVAEEFFINSISSTLEIGGVQYDELNKNMSKQTKNFQGEFDIVLINGKELLIIETKYKAHLNDLNDLINKQHKNFKNLYPQYNNYTQHLALASFYISDDIKKEALSNNVMILQRKGDIIETIMP